MHWSCAASDRRLPLDSLKQDILRTIPQCQLSQRDEMFAPFRDRQKVVTGELPNLA